MKNSAYLEKFDKRVVPGTMVLLGYWGWHVVKTVHETRKWIEIDGLVGSFQRRDVLRFTNKCVSSSFCKKSAMK